MDGSCFYRSLNQNFPPTLIILSRDARRAGSNLSDTPFQDTAEIGIRKSGTEKSGDFTGPLYPHTFFLFACFPAQHVWLICGLVKMGIRIADEAVLVRRWQAWEVGDPGGRE